MSAYLLLIHTLNFLAAPAFVALLLAGLARLFYKPNRPLVQGLPAQAAIIFVANTVALLLAWLVRGQDGTVAGYAAMVVSSAVCQWVLLGSWRSSRKETVSLPADR